MVNDTDTPEIQPSKAPRDRSPAYPFISLRSAVDRLAAFEAKFGRHPAPADKVGLAWKMKEKSSQAFQTLAALKAYGLVDYRGASKDRVAFLSDDGRNYLRAQQASTKTEILKVCALRPKAIHKYWLFWGADRPIDEICLDELVLKAAFTQSAAQTFLRVYDETVAFAGLVNGDKVDVSADDDGDDGDDGDDQDRETDVGSVRAPVVAPKIGDFVRWEAGGVIQFAARRVLGVTADGSHVFVEGSSTGLPTKEITVLPQSPTLPPLPSLPQAPISSGAITNAVGTKQDTFTLDEGPVVLQWPSQLSETSYEDFKDWIELQLRKIKRSIQ